MPIVTDHTALIGGNSWSGIEVSGRPVIVTYSFPTSAPAYDAGIAGFTAATVASFAGFSADQQDQARAALADWAAASGIVFVEVDPGQGDINFQIADLDTTTTYAGAGGIAFEPFGDWNFFSYPQFEDDLDSSGDVFMSSQFIVGGVIDQATLLHEIGHAIGLKHPTEVRTNFAPDPDVVHDEVLASDDPALTIMATVGGTAALKQLDMDAAAFLYGASGGAVVTGDASGSNAVVSSWSWNAAAQTLTQAGFDGAAAADIVRGSSVIDIVSGLGGDDRLFGLAGDDTLDGGAGDDELFGGGGADAMTGGAGDDTYYIEDAGDAANELAGEGFDSALAAVSHALAANVELLQLFGAGLTGTGNGLANTIFGDGGLANTLLGLGGADYIVAGAGNDTVDGGGDGDTLFGGAGNDTLNGGAGIDSMTGGTGDDLYVVTSAGETVTELAGEGSDTVQASVAYTLGANVERLKLIGAAAIDGTGNGGGNFIDGNAAANTLTGLGGADRLDGKGGADTMIGGLGDEIYYIDNAGDAVTELAGQGTDLLRSTLAIDLTVILNIENATVTSSANAAITGSSAANVLTGGNGANTISGGDGDDTIRGNFGADTMDGGGGADTFVWLGLNESVGASRDTIAGFVSGTDRLDLIAIDANATVGGNQDFVLDLDASFSSGEFRQTMQGADLLLEGNTDGDAAAEISVLFTGILSLGPGDFV